MYYYFHMFRRLRKILPSALLLNIYKTYVQSKIDYGLSIWGCTTEVNLNRVQRIQNLLVRIICNNFHYTVRDGVSNHQPHDCLLNRLFSQRPKKTSKLRVTGLCNR